MEVTIIEKPKSWISHMSDMGTSQTLNFPGRDFSSIRAMISSHLKRKYPDRKYRAIVDMVSIPGQVKKVPITQVTRLR